MTIQTPVFVGNQADDGSGDKLRDAFIKVNERFQQIAALFQNKGTWTAGTQYVQRDYVYNAGTAYVCVIDHTASGTFATDMAAGKWANVDALDLRLDLASSTTGKGASLVYDAAKASDLASTATGKGAALVGFKQSGAGAVARTAQDKMREVVSVKDFGAVLDGAADDTAAFSSAAALGVPVFVPGKATKLTADVAGEFYSFGNVAIAGAGYANIKDQSKDLRKPSLTPIGPIEIIAHRGFMGQAPQNTMLAFSTSLSRGADSLEMDLQVSSDGVIYIFHDTTVDALTSGTGTFTALSSATIDALTFDATAGTAFADETIPRFSDVLKLARESGVKIYPEIKGVWTEAQMIALLDILDDYGFNNERCVIQASYIVYCEELRTLSPSVGIAYVGTGAYAATISFVDRLKAIGGELAWNMNDLLFQPEIVTYCYGKGVDVVAWTISTSDQVRRLASIGVRKVMTDISVGGSV